MKKFMLLMVCIFMLIGCSSDKYSQKEQPLKFEVNTKKEDADNSIKKELLKNDKALSESEIKDITLNYDEILLKKLGVFEVKISKEDEEILIFKVKVEDSTKPTIKLEGTKFEIGINLEDKITLSDNYEKEDILKSNLMIEGFDKDKEGEQEITVSTMDSSKNKATEKVKITLVPSETEGANQENAKNPSNSNGNNGNSYSSSENNNSTSNNGSSTNNGSNGGTWTPPVTTPVEPPKLCPGGNDEYQSCDTLLWSPGWYYPKIFNTIEESDAWLGNWCKENGYTMQGAGSGALYYNDGSVKYYPHHPNLK